MAALHLAGDDLDLAGLVTQPAPRGVLARGLGRSYGDAAQNAGGVVVDMTSRNRVLSIDTRSGLVTAEAGVSFDSMIRTLLPLGLFPAVTPGTRQVTVGGAVAADVHGKNHHVDGSFGDHLVDLDLLCADGSLRHLTPDDDLFWATVGGMGLTGLVVRATMQMRSVSTAFCLVDTDRCPNLDDLLGRMSHDDDEYAYSVAWVDCLATGSSLGRSVLTRGRLAAIDQLPSRRRVNPLVFQPRQGLVAASWTPDHVLNRWSVGAFNEVWYRKSPRHRRDELQSLSRFLYPLDGVGEWNRIYGPRGFMQYQFVVPFGAEETLRRCLEMVAEAGQGCFLAVLKRLGPVGRGHLSFPTAGWTLTLDMPASDERVGPLLDRLDETVLEAHGRIYLAKDSRLPSEAVPVMYPRLQEWRRLRDSVDPAGRFVSDLARRLQL